MTYKYTYKLVEALEDGTELVSYNGLKPKHLKMAEKLSPGGTDDQDVFEKILVDISDLESNQIEDLSLIDHEHLYEELMLKQIIPFRNKRLSVTLAMLKEQGLYEGIKDQAIKSTEPKEVSEDDFNEV